MSRRSESPYPQASSSGHPEAAMEMNGVKFDSDLVECSLQQLQLRSQSSYHGPRNNDASDLSSIAPHRGKLVITQESMNDFKKAEGEGSRPETGKERDWQDVGYLPVELSVWSTRVFSKSADGQSRSFTHGWASIPPMELPAFLDPRSLMARSTLRKHEPIRVVLAEITKPVVYFDDCDELADSFMDYFKAITKIQMYGLALRSVGPENLSISASTWEGVIVCLDEVDIRLQEKRRHLPPIINTFPAKLPKRKLERCIFDPWDTHRQIFLCFIWVMTTRRGPGNEKRPKYEWSVPDMAFSAIYDWNKKGKLERRLYEPELKKARKRKNEIMNNFENFEKEVVKYVHPYFRKLEHMLRVFRALLYDVRWGVIRQVILGEKTLASFPGTKKAEEEPRWVSEMRLVMVETQDAWNPEWSSKQQAELDGIVEQMKGTDENRSCEAYERGKLPDGVVLRDNVGLDWEGWRDESRYEASPFQFVRGRRTSARLVEVDMKIGSVYTLRTGGEPSQLSGHYETSCSLQPSRLHCVRNLRGGIVHPARREALSIDRPLGDLTQNEVTARRNLCEGVVEVLRRFGKTDAVLENNAPVTEDEAPGRHPPVLVVLLVKVSDEEKLEW